ncbi:MAG: hypothetical protein ACOC0U_03135 [Desulfovibrionales bacterium]
MRKTGTHDSFRHDDMIAQCSSEIMGGKKPGKGAFQHYERCPRNSYKPNCEFVPDGETGS